MVPEGCSVRLEEALNFPTVNQMFINQWDMSVAATASVDHLETFLVECCNRISAWTAMTATHMGTLRAFLGNAAMQCSAIELFDFGSGVNGERLSDSDTDHCAILPPWVGTAGFHQKMACLLTSAEEQAVGITEVEMPIGGWSNKSDRMEFLYRGYLVDLATATQVRTTKDAAVVTDHLKMQRLIKTERHGKVFWQIVTLWKVFSTGPASSSITKSIYTTS